MRQVLAILTLIVFYTSSALSSELEVCQFMASKAIVKNICDEYKQPKLVACESNSSVILTGDADTRWFTEFSKKNQVDTCISIDYANWNKDTEIFHLMFTLIARMTSIILLSTILLLYHVTPDIVTHMTRCFLDHIAAHLAADILAVIITTCLVADDKNGGTVFVNIVFRVCIFFVLVSSTWFGLIAFEFWRNINFSTSKQNEDLIFKVYIFWAYGIPLSLMIFHSFVPTQNCLDLSIDTNKGGGHTILNFYFPDPLQHMLILAFWVSSIYLYWRRNKSDSNTIYRWRPFLLMFTLIEASALVECFMEVRSYNHEQSGFLRNLEILLHSSLLFGFLVYGRNCLLKKIAENRAFGFSWPESWKQLTDNEAATSRANEVELDQTNVS